MMSSASSVLPPLSGRYFHLGAAPATEFKCFRHLLEFQFFEGIVGRPNIMNFSLES